MKKAAIITLTIFTLIASLVIALEYHFYVIRILLTPHTGYEYIGENIYVSSTIPQKQHQKILEDFQQARKKINHTFGPPLSRPCFIITDTKLESEQLGANLYGTTHVFPVSRAYIIIGPKGRNPDVLAHEWVHAEIEHRLGFFCYTFQFPAWLNEGIACLVDDRIPVDPAALNQIGRNYALSLFSLKEFADVSPAKLAMHYRASKFLALELAQLHGTHSIFPLLDNFKQDGSMEPFLAASEP